MSSEWWRQCFVDAAACSFQLRQSQTVPSGPFQNNVSEVSRSLHDEVRQLRNELYNLRDDNQRLVYGNRLLIQRIEGEWKQTNGDRGRTNTGQCLLVVAPIIYRLKRKYALYTKQMVAIVTGWVTTKEDHPPSYTIQPSNVDMMSA